MVQAEDWVERTFGRFAWRDDPRQRGRVEILGEWERRNIVSFAPPFELRNGQGRPVSAIQCHRLIAPALQSAFEEIVARELAHLVNTFDGCFVPRHMGWDPRRPLSRHAWGIAVDLNARLCPYGSDARQDPRLVAVFQRHGFEWGGGWRVRDPMHFEVIDLAQPARPIQVLVDGERVAAGFLYEGRAVGPIREIAEALGARVEARVAQGEVEIHTPSGGELP